MRVCQGREGVPGQTGSAGTSSEARRLRRRNRLVTLLPLPLGRAPRRSLGMPRFCGVNQLARDASWRQLCSFFSLLDCLPCSLTCGHSRATTRHRVRCIVSCVDTCVTSRWGEYVLLSVSFYYLERHRCIPRCPDAVTPGDFTLVSAEHRRKENRS